MKKNRYSRFFSAAFFILMALWIATPKVYIHDLLKHNHTAVEIGIETKVSSQTTDDCDFENYNKPTYFSLFKFICSFIPAKKQHAENVSTTPAVAEVLSQAILFFRGPPVTE